MIFVMLGFAAVYVLPLIVALVVFDHSSGNIASWFLSVTLGVCTSIFAEAFMAPCFKDPDDAGTP